MLFIKNGCYSWLKLAKGEVKIVYLLANNKSRNLDLIFKPLW